MTIGHNLSRVRADNLVGPAAGASATAVGNCRFENGGLDAIARRDGMNCAWTAAFSIHGVDAPAHVRGDFAVAVRDSRGRLFLAVDRFSICSLYYRVDGNVVQFAERADEVAGHFHELDAQALFNYLYFHFIPAPRTAFKGVQRLPAGHYALFEKGELTVAPWWSPVFDEGRADSFDGLRDEFRALLHDSVQDQLSGQTTGCFLSGGTDSSTVAGMLGRITAAPAPTFSIGFDAEGYDEMEYARLAARHFKTDHHEYYVTPDDLVRSIPAIAAAYDQPFGNSSVAPAYYCAKMAKEAGIERLLAGDGGDELFGGNTRYAKQRVFGIYGRIPAVLRKVLLEPALLRWPAPARIPGVKKAVSYVEQARVAMPDRLEMYNLLTRLGLDRVLTPEFLAGIDPAEPLRQQRTVYAASNASSMINRMLAYDWKYTLAYNDLPKVIGATNLAGVSAGFPLLDNRLVDFSLRLPPALKVRGMKLRWFFKEALRDFLPDEIIDKTKHGFGLPFGVWMTRHAGLKALALDSLESLRGRGIVRSDFLDRLTKEYLPQFPGYYGEMVWVLMMLAQWDATSKRRLRRRDEEEDTEGRDLASSHR